MIAGIYIERPKLDARIVSGLVTADEIESYLTGQAMAPVLAAETEYQALLEQEGQPDIVDGAGVVISSPNAERDARLALLLSEFPHLDLPAEEWPENRPEVILDLDQWRAFLKQYAKGKFLEAMKTGACPLSLGWEIDCRRDAGKEDISNMERLRDKLIREGAPDAVEVEIRGADNAPHLVTLAELRDTIIPEMVDYGLMLYQQKWAAEAQIDDAQLVEDLKALQLVL